MTNHLPYSARLPVNLLAHTFRNTSATYKFYWFLSVIQLFENEGREISKKRIFAKMLSNAWYTVNYFKVSFGKQDKIQIAVQYFNEVRNIPIDLSQELVFNEICSLSDFSSTEMLKHFDNQVPHWFIAPWFPGSKKDQIYVGSRIDSNLSPYELWPDRIVISDVWAEYLTCNSAILKDFCFWNLCLFLQSRNPNVPDIPNKLIKPINRKPLARHKKDYWNLVFDQSGGEMECIFSGQILSKDNYALDHFIPYNFVSHDLNWNLIPAHPSINSSKSDKLPHLDKYFNKFFEIQRAGFEIVSRSNPQSKFREDFLTIFSSYDDFLDNDVRKAKVKFKESIEPLITIAHNNGFVFYEK